MTKVQTIILVALLTAVTLGAGVLFVAWFNNSEAPPAPTPAQPTQTIDSFDACVDAGYPVQESYPEVCAAPGQGSFTNPNQSLN